MNFALTSMNVRGSSPSSMSSGLISILISFSDSSYVGLQRMELWQT